MNKIQVPCAERLKLHVVGKSLHNGHDFLVRTNSRSKIIDYLFFFDSRGISSQFENSLAEQLTNNINDSGKSFLLICRPLEMTTRSVLISILENSEIKPKKIVTNVGFVDFTPKNEKTLALSIDQVHSVLGAGVAKANFAEYYLTSESVRPIYNTQYDRRYLDAIESITEKNDIVVINTQTLSQNISLARARPLSFFSGVLEANEFNRSISCAKIIEVPEFDELFTYDGVHFTLQGNNLVFELVRQVL